MMHPPAPPKQWWADVAGGAAVLSVVVVIGLWLSHGGLRSLAGGDGPAMSAGRLTGLVAADLLLLQVLLMARVPWIERAYGQDRLARKHRLVAYAHSDGHGLLGEAWSLTTTYPGMLIAVVGTGLLVGVVALSIRAARRRLRYESWHLLHLYAYLGVGLALPHEIWTGADFIATPAARAYWWSAYALTLAAVLVFRVGMPIWRSAYHRLEVKRVVTEADGVVSVYLRGRHLDELPVRAGQFFLWRFLDGPGWTRANPYSLSAAPRKDLLRITVKNLGDGSARLATLKPGTKAFVEGPYGAMTGAVRRQRKVLLLAAGVGITAMRALLDEVRPGSATLVYRFSQPQDLVFRGELDAFATKRKTRVVYLEGPRGPDDSWLPAQLAHMGEVQAMRWLVPDLTAHDVFVCGPSAWMESVEATLRHAGVPDSQIHSEQFAW
jgi:predicted ferric reductase